MGRRVEEIENLAKKIMIKEIGMGKNIKVVGNYIIHPWLLKKKIFTVQTFILILSYSRIV